MNNLTRHMVALRHPGRSPLEGETRGGRRGEETTMIDESIDRATDGVTAAVPWRGKASPTWFEESGGLARRERLTVTILAGLCLGGLAISWARGLWQEALVGGTESAVTVGRDQASSKSSFAWERDGGTVFREEGEPLQPRLGLATLDSGGRDAAKAEHKEESPPETAINRLDLNQANAIELQGLPGIGPVLAQRILAERVRGPFQSLEDLAERVRGIGPRTAERLRPWVVCSPSRPATAQVNGEARP